MKKLLYLSCAVLVFTMSGCFSCDSWHEFWGNGPVEPGAKYFWQKSCKPVAAKSKAAVPAPKTPEPKVQAASSGCPKADVANTASAAYPCEGCGVLHMKKTMPTTVQVGKTFDYTIDVKNLSKAPVSDVVVTESLPSNFILGSTQPKASLEGGTLIWQAGSLKPDESRKLTVTGKANDTAGITTCAEATYKTPVCAATMGVQPSIKLEKTAVESVLICDDIPMKYTVSNLGTGVATNVSIMDTLPEGLVTADGSKTVKFNVASLDCGKSVSFPVTAKATKTGRFSSKATAAADGDLGAESADTTTVVSRPVLAITKTGPEKRYIGREASYQITVSNKGDAPAAETVVIDTVPAGASFVSASTGGTMSGGHVKWDIGTLGAGTSRTLEATYMAPGAGVLTNTATASAVCAETVRATARTTISGISAVLLEVIDVSDPIEVGNNETYVITVTNQGSAADTNVTIKCMLEEGMQYVSASGDTPAVPGVDTVAFQPLATLAPKAKATWRVVVKATKAGDMRFKVLMNTDQLDRDVQETEATNFYE